MLISHALAMGLGRAIYFISSSPKAQSSQCLFCVLQCFCGFSDVFFSQIPSFIDQRVMSFVCPCGGLGGKHGIQDQPTQCPIESSRSFSAILIVAFYIRLRPDSLSSTSNTERRGRPTTILCACVISLSFACYSHHHSDSERLC